MPFEQALVNPKQLNQELSITPDMAEFVHNSRTQVANIIQGHDSRLLMIVGPCSIHDTTAALEYAKLLKAASIRFADDLFIVMRVYFEKPRTTIGWKGLISDPYLNNTFDTNHGLRLARNLLRDLAKLKLPAGTEFLETFTLHYISELISWGAIGARTTESQIHRELASSLNMPVGFKNTTDGNIKIAIDAVNTARHSHHFLSINSDGIPCIMQTNGNSQCHIVLRGSNSEANYTANHIKNAATALQNAKLAPYLMVDCSHGNSMKNHQTQIHVANSLAEQISHGSSIIRGIMLESNLIGGNQRLENNNPLQYGQSITDECLAWNDTLSLLEKFSLAVQKRRANQPLPLLIDCDIC